MDNVLFLETFRSGATGVVANDIDPNCRLALDMNAELSKQSLDENPVTKAAVVEVTSFWKKITSPR